MSLGLLRSARRLLRKKERVLEERFLAEGRQAVAEALGRPDTVLELLVATDAVGRHQDLLTAAKQVSVRVHGAAPADLAGLCDTVTPQGVVAVCRSVDVPLGQSLAGRPQLVVVCDQVRDPGNLGTVVRCADAFGADAVVVTGDSVDLYNGKTVRATTGSLFHLPVTVQVELAGVVAAGRSAGLQVLGADGATDRTIERLATDGVLARPTMWVLGNEAWGLPPERAALLDGLVALPMYGRAESLNLSTAAAVFLYASATAQHSLS